MAQKRPRVRPPREEATAEIETHLQMRVEALVAMGWSESAARAEAERRFGDARGVQIGFERTMQRQRRRARRREVSGMIGNSLLITMRQLRRAPVFTLAVVLSLGVALAANATMFRIVDRLLLRAPGHLVTPERVSRIFYRFGYDDGNEVITPQAGYERYQDLSRLESFDPVAAVFTTELTVGEGVEAQARRVMLATASFWRLFDAPPALGRYFTEEENILPRGAEVAVLSYGEWRTRFGGAMDVLGRSLRIGSGIYTVIGVAPPSFTGLDLQPVTAFVPMTTAGADVMGPGFAFDFTGTWLEIIARRRPGVSPEAAERELTLAVERSYFDRYPQAPSSVRASGIAAPVLRDRGPQASEASKVALWLMGVAGIVLLIACANVANLLLVRTLERRRELAVRVALGVSRVRLLAQLLTESFVLAVAGGVLGLLLAMTGGVIVQAFLVPDIDWSGGFVDGRLLLFTALATLLTGLIVAILPLVRGLDVDIAKTIRSSGRNAGSASARARTTLLMVQALLATVLLSGAGLFVQSLRNARSIDLGFDADRIVYARVSLQGSGMDSENVAGLIERLLQRARALPGVTSAARTTSVPFWRNNYQQLYVEGVDSVARLGIFALNAVSEGFFETVGTRVLRGRAITDSDGEGAQPVAVVSESMARVLWPGADPLGQCFRVSREDGPCRVVVGIAEDVRRSSLTGDQPYQYYLPWSQYPGSGTGIFMRVERDAARVAARLQPELQQLVPQRALVRVDPLLSRIEMQVQSWRLGAAMFTLFGAIALVLTALGLFSVISYSVAQRRHEFSVRMALGATRANVRGMILRQATGVAAAGIMLGLLITLAPARWVQPLLFGVSPRSPAILGAVALVLLVVALAGSAVPAIAAGRTSVGQSLRSE